MTEDKLLKSESDLLEKVIDEKFKEFTKKLYNVKVENFEIINSFKAFCYELKESYLYELRFYVDNRFYTEPGIIIINGLGYTQPTDIIKYNLQILVSQKHKQFDTLYHQYLSDNLSES